MSKICQRKVRVEEGHISLVAQFRPAPAVMRQCCQLLRSHKPAHFLNQKVGRHPAAAAGRHKRVMKKKTIQSN